ncbi:hypothetical protein QFC22_005806 [Naganishia vaughanmartiniae]|uniref:Uncharacterized protein n=1 Tax=Naganishia vaughanmartiniae TaxID=1424756 RepID=A0ACC2WRC6_9TREE|nr:hypothetical protein QFC22_005806 [Naganishia vaughanmartiniae]
MSTVDPLSTSVQQWLFTPIQLTRTPSQQPSTSSTEHPDDSWSFGDEYQKRREAIMFLMAVQKDLQFHNPVKQQVDQWKFQQKTHLQQQQQQQQGGMGMQYGRPTNPMQQMGMGMQQGRYGQNNSTSTGMMDQQQQQQVVNLEAMSIKDLLAHSGIFGHPNSAEYLHWVNVNQEFEQVAYARDVAYTAASYLHRFFMRRSLRDYKAKEIAVACLYLALKAEERMNIKIRVVARAFKAKLGQANAVSPPPPHWLLFTIGWSDDRVLVDSVFQQTDYFENTIANYEDLVLETLCYDLPIPQPLGYVLRAHTFFHPPSSHDDTHQGKEPQTQKEKKVSVWDEDEDGYGLSSSSSMHKNHPQNRFQQQLYRQTQEKRLAAEARKRKRQAQEDMRGEELQRAAFLDLAYLICDET